MNVFISKMHELLYRYFQHSHLGKGGLFRHSLGLSLDGDQLKVNSGRTSVICRERFSVGYFILLIGGYDVAIVLTKSKSRLESDK